MHDSFCQVIKFINTIPAIIIHHTRKSSTVVQSHWHLDLEINVLFEGMVKFYINGEQNEITSGQVCLINSEAVHHSIPYFNGDDNTIVGFTLIINHNFISSLIPDYSNHYFVMKNKKEEQEIALLLYKISDIYLYESDAGSKIMILSHICEILSILCRKSLCDKKIENINKWRDTERIRIVLEYLHQNYNQPLRQQQVAEQFHFTREYFARFFKKYTGRTFKEYLTECQVIHAERMLRETTDSVLLIAQRNGFADERRFIQSFSKYYSTTPGNYRKNL